LPADASSRVPDTLPAEERSASISGAAPAVLVIDDDPSARDLLRRSMSAEGYQVDCAVSGEDGLRLARERHPAIIILDVLLPGIDGCAVLRALKADPDLANIPVVMQTIVDDKNQGFALGAIDYLTKPVDRERLAWILARYRQNGSSSVTGA
jgi:DNA-binding response OmpR family regulator